MGESNSKHLAEQTKVQIHIMAMTSKDANGEGNGTPLQYSCLENPMDGGAWWVAVYGVAQSRTRLKRLSSSSSKDAHRKSNGKVKKISFSQDGQRRPPEGDDTQAAA